MCLFLTETADSFNMDAYTQLTPNDLLQLLQSVWVTLYVTVIALAIGTILGILLGISRCSKNKILKYAPLIIIEPLRNSPLIVQLFLVYFGVPVLTGQVLPLYPAAIGTLALNTAAFMAVQVQTSILSIPRGQWEASLALGHSYASTYINVIAQQAIRILLPQAITLYISQLMCSSLVSLLGVMDLSRLAKFTATRTMQPFLIYGIISAVYFALAYPFTKLAKSLEKRISINL